LAKFNIKSIGYAKGEKNRSVTAGWRVEYAETDSVRFLGLEEG